jgi:tetrathionate reductase subunit B
VTTELPVIQPPAPPAPGPAGPPAGDEPAPHRSLGDRLLDRRGFLGFGITLVAGAAGAGALARLFPVFADTEPGPAPIVPVYDPETVAWTYIVDTEKCIGCGQCVRACKTENHVPEAPEFTRTWIERHVVEGDGRIVVDSPEGGIAGFPATPASSGYAAADAKAAYFVPRLCMQCEASPCTQVCPVGATYKTPDGVILVDARRCIGCGYCITACPYGARYIVPADESSPKGVAGVADKCTWCYHRLARGMKPACVEVCPVGARTFGDRNDPEAEVTRILAERKPEMLRPEYGTRPRVLYLGPVNEEA